ncbi:MAG: BatA and WFA domain-containing protein [Verrucomicrobiota bacterium]
MPFVYSGFLWGLAALAIPLWLHLSRKRQYRKMPIGTLRFLEEILRERRKRSRFEEWPLLILRLLCVTLLTLVFMRPFMNSAQETDAERVETVVLADASGSVTASMAEEARDLMRRTRRGARDGEKVTLLEFSDAAGEISSVDAYRPRAGAPTDLPLALNQALDRFSNFPPGSTGRVVLIAHLAAADLPGVPPRVWPPGITLEVLPLRQPGVDNAAVLGVSLLTPYVTEEMEIETLVSLPAGLDRTVTLEAEGLTLKQTLPAGSDRLVFKFHPPRAEMRGTIRVAGGDAWPADDQRPFAVRWLEPRRILLVDSHPGSTPYEGQAYFLQKALTASGAVHGKTPFQPEIVFGLTGRSGPADLSGTAAVALCGVPPLSASETEMLKQFTAGGGGVISFLDSRWTPAAANALTGAGLAPADVKLTDGAELTHLTGWNKDHPALAVFDGKEGGDLTPLEWRDSFNLHDTPGWRTLAALEGGHSLLMEKTPPADDAAGREKAKEEVKTKEGRVLLLAHPMTREWGDLPREPIFVPLVKTLFSWVAKAETGLPEVPPIAPGLKESRAPGLYTAADGSTVIIAAAPAESAVAPATAEAFRAAFGVPDEVASAAAAVEAQKPDPALAKSMLPSRWEFWPWLALALMILLMAETLLATRKPQNSGQAA